MSARDVATEEVVLRELGDRIARELGEDPSEFLDLIVRRIAHGASVYGDDAFTHPGRDNVREHAEEMADGVAYPLFELHLLNQRPDAPEGAHQLLFDAMFYAAVSHTYALRYRRLLHNQ